MEPISSTEPGAPFLSARAIQALGSTQSWARFAGIAMLGCALLKLIQTGFVLSHFHATPQLDALGPAAQNIALGTTVVVALITVAIYAIIGWLALRYAERLNRVKPPWQPGSKDIVMALGAQHSYWRFQGIVIAVGLGLLALGFIL
ncbi:MAG: hypothetical protein ACRETC_10495, partial [Gammaproteobacteria bacterium]